eukprot:scaffold22293_cov62-Isochrysis_galbana.AAC.1
MGIQGRRGCGSFGEGCRPPGGKQNTELFKIVTTGSRKKDGPSREESQECQPSGGKQHTKHYENKVGKREGKAPPVALARNVRGFGAKCRAVSVVAATRYRGG